MKLSLCGLPQFLPQLVLKPIFLLIYFACLELKCLNPKLKGFLHFFCEVHKAGKNCDFSALQIWGTKCLGELKKKAQEGEQSSYHFGTDVFGFSHIFSYLFSQQYHTEKTIILILQLQKSSLDESKE